MTNSITIIREYRYALEGVSCASCVSTVRAALQQPPSEGEDNKNDGIQSSSVTVSLYPEPKLILRRHLIREEEEKRQEKEEDCIVKQRLEECGFGATLLGYIDIDDGEEEDDDLNDNNKNGKKNIDAKIKAKKRRRMVRLELEEGLLLLLDDDDDGDGDALLAYLRGNESCADDHGIIDARIVNNPRHNKLGNNSWWLRCWSYSRVRNDDVTTMHSSPIVLEIMHDPKLAPIRDILDKILKVTRSTTTSLQSSSSHNNNHYPIRVRCIDDASFASEEAERRRTQDLHRKRNTFLLSTILTIPVLFIHISDMQNLPGAIGTYLSSLVDPGNWNATWGELWAWILTTPVQFGSGRTFYVEAYRSIRLKRLGMGFLVAAGTTAAYVYGMLAVCLNASRRDYNNNDGDDDDNNHMNNGHGTDMLTPAFETSALLITFVLLGRYLESRVRGVAGRALSGLAELVPDEARLLGAVTKGMKGRMRMGTVINALDSVDQDDNDEDDNDDTNDDNNDTDNYEKDINNNIDETIEVNSYDEQTIQSSLIQKYDVLLVSPGSRFPTDGVVLSGSTYADESMLTGEARPVRKYSLLDKMKKDNDKIENNERDDKDNDNNDEKNSDKQDGDFSNYRVYGGTTNLNAPVSIVVMAWSGSDTTLSAIAATIERAGEDDGRGSNNNDIKNDDDTDENNDNKQKTIKTRSTAELADAASAIFVPAVAIFAASAVTIWAILLNVPGLISESTKRSWSYRDQGWTDETLPIIFGLGSLVAACPCAMGLAAPAAIVAGCGVGAGLGILFRGGEALESLGRVDAMCFDKVNSTLLEKSLTSGPSIAVIICVHVNLRHASNHKLTPFLLL